MNITTKSTTTLTCPNCKNTSTYDLTLHDLADGRKIVCGKCGRDIVIDRSAFAKAEEFLENVPASNLFSTKTVVKSSMSFQCPRCGKTTTTDTTIGRLLDGEKVFCSHCGSEIHADGAKLQEADAALRGLAAPPGSEGKMVGTTGAPVVVKTKTFSFNVNKTLDIGKKPETDAGGSAGGTPIITPRRSIEPKRGCLGVMVVISVVSAVAVLCWLFSW
jgi:transcription elongation factor Elf1